MVDTRATGFLYSLAVFAVLVNFGSLQDLTPRIAGRTIHYDFKLFLVRPLPAPPVTTQTPLVPVGNTTGNSSGGITDPTITHTMKVEATTITVVPDENATVAVTTNETDAVIVVTTTGPPEPAGPTVTTTGPPEPAGSTDTTTGPIGPTVFLFRRRLLSLSTNQLDEELRTNITTQLVLAFNSVTGYKEVSNVNLGKATNATEANEERRTVNYTVVFDAQPVSNCLRSESCNFTGQIAGALDRVTKMTTGGEYSVNRNWTGHFNIDFVKRESEPGGRLANGCTALMPCVEYGIRVTCRYDKSQESCVDVCRNPRGYCAGGTCRANNNVLNGARICECPTHTFHNNWRCLSWWILLGPIIGAGALLIIFLIVMCVLCVRLAQKNKKDKLRNMYNGKDSLQRYHDEGNDNEGFMPQPLPLERYDTTNMANGNTKATPLEKKPSYREEVSPSRGSDTQQPMQEIGPQSQYRPAAEERQLHRYSDHDHQKGPDTNMYSNNWERELAKQYDSRDFNLSSVPQEKFQFERPKLNSPSHGYAEQPVARF